MSRTSGVLNLWLCRNTGESEYVECEMLAGETGRAFQLGKSKAMGYEITNSPHGEMLPHLGKIHPTMSKYPFPNT